MPDASHGYPCAFRGDEIPLGARIFAVVDAYDAITSDRSYRKGQAPSVRSGGDQAQCWQSVRSLGSGGFATAWDQ